MNRTLIAVLVSLLLCAGCGNGSNNNSGTSTTTPTIYPNTPSLQGEWQFIFTSQHSMPTTVVDIASAQGNSTAPQNGVAQAALSAYTGFVFTACAGCGINVADSGGFTVPDANKTFSGTVSYNSATNTPGGVSFSVGNIQAQGGWGWSSNFTTIFTNGTYTNAVTGDAGTWVATSSYNILSLNSSVGTFTMGGAQWTWTGNLGEYSLDEAPQAPTNQYEGSSTGSLLTLQSQGQQGLFVVIPDSTVPSGFDLAWYSNTQFVGLLTNQTYSSK